MGPRCEAYWPTRPDHPQRRFGRFLTYDKFSYFCHILDMPRHHRSLDREGMLSAFAALDALLEQHTRLVVGGGAAMALAYHHPLTTSDVDGFTTPGSPPIATLEHLAKRVASELALSPDWLNAHFVTFTHVLPPDYALRLRPVFQGKFLRVDALGPEDLLVMKCFASRDKDRSHALALLRGGADASFVDDYLSKVIEQRLPGADRAADFFDDVREEADL